MFRRNLIPIFILLIIFIFIVQPETVSKGFFAGINIWINNIVPFLFPMSILANILLQYNFIYSLLGRFSKLSEKIFKSRYAMIPYFISFISGYPSGALSTNIMCANKRIDCEESNYLTCFANNCSFQFIAGSVAFSMLGNFRLWKYIAFPHFAGAVILSFLLENKGRSVITAKIYSRPPRFNNVFSTAISKSIAGIFSVCSVIIIFSIFSILMTNVISSSHLINILSPVIRDAVYGIIIGMMEMTNGCSIIAGSSIPIEIKLIIINFLISFSGASILFQTIAVTSDFILDLKRYMISRFIFGVMSSLLCSFMLILL